MIAAAAVAARMLSSGLLGHRPMFACLIRRRCTEGSHAFYDSAVNKSAFAEAEPCCPTGCAGTVLF